jgi:DNA-binding transcriptional MocR family regulator
MQHLERIMNSPEMTPYGQACARPSPVNRMMTAFSSDFRENQDINLGVGYVNEDTIPRLLIRKALDEITGNPGAYSRAFNYGSPHGSDRLIQSLRSFLARHTPGLSSEILDSRRVIIGANGVTSLLESIAQLVRPGLVVVADPLYYIYCDFLVRKGFEIVPVPEDEHGIRTDAIEPAIRGRLDSLSFFYVVTVGNPTCSILADSRRTELVSLVKDLSHRCKRTLPLFLDGAYEFLVHGEGVSAPRSALSHDREGLTFELGSMSKLLAPALRIGYMLAPPSPFADALVQRISDVGFSAPVINQELCSYLIDHHIDEQIQRVNREYHEKAVQVRQWLDAYLGDELEAISGGAAGFYYYLTLKQTITEEGSAFFRFLSRTTGDPHIDGPAGDCHPRVAYIPGSHCVSATGAYAKIGRRQMRISYGYEELDAIEQAIECIADAVSYARDRRRLSR